MFRVFPIPLQHHQAGGSVGGILPSFVNYVQQQHGAAAISLSKLILDGSSRTNK